MPPVVIENPILNSPFAEPSRHFRFGELGITDEIVAGRRESSYFIPIPQARKKSQQTAFDTEWTRDRIQPNDFINRVRARVALWRRGGFVGVTSTTARLLQHWQTPPYERLQRALRAEIDESAWAQLYTTTSLPFDPPSTGKFAVKVINHYGDEVLKVFDIKR